MMQQPQIVAAWNELRAAVSADSTEPGEIPTQVTSVENSRGPLRLVVKSSGTRGLLIPVDRAERIDEVQRSDSIVVRKCDYSVDGQRTPFLEVECINDNLIDVFADMTSDLLRRISEGKPGLRALDESLDEFRNLIAARSIGGKSAEEIAGLIGELLLLNELLSSNSGIWKGWHGPHSDRHDFRMGAFAIEVKTSMQAGGQVIRVHGIEQLSEPSQGQLYLQHWQIEPNPTGNLVVSKLVDQAYALADNPDALSDRLEKLDFSAETADAWDHIRFQKIAGAMYEVTHLFPRLTPETIGGNWPINGISCVEYQVDLGVARTCRMTDEQRAPVIRKISKCL